MYQQLEVLDFATVNLMCISHCSEMKRNKIKIVDSLTFKGMDSLKSLKLQRNGITKLMDGAFFGLNNIEEL